MVKKYLSHLFNATADKLWFWIRKYFGLRLRTIQSRWGFLSVLSTLSLGLLAIGIALLAWRSNHAYWIQIIMDVFIVISLCFALMLGGLFLIFGMYFLRKEAEPDEYTENIEKSIDAINKSQSSMAKSLQTISKSLKNIEKTNKKIGVRIL